MKIRNPFKDKWLRWRDDITQGEKLFWGLISASIGMIIARLLNLGELLRTIF